MVNATSFFKLFIPTTETLNQDIDLIDILRIIGSNKVVSWTWGVERLDWLGHLDNFETTLPQETDRAPEHRVLVSGKRLLEQVEKVYQSLEGSLIAYSSQEKARSFLEEDWWTVDFESSSAEILIKIIGQSIGFEVYLRSKSLADQFIQHFQDVQLQAPADFLVY